MFHWNKARDSSLVYFLVKLLPKFLLAEQELQQVQYRILLCCYLVYSCTIPLKLLLWWRVRIGPVFCLV